MLCSPPPPFPFPQSGLLGVWGIRSWIPFAAARRERKLVDHMRYIYTSDWLMKQEGGVETLTPEALVEVNITLLKGAI